MALTDDATQSYDMSLAGTIAHTLLLIISGGTETAFLSTTMRMHRQILPHSWDNDPVLVLFDFCNATTYALQPNSSHVVSFVALCSIGKTKDIVGVRSMDGSGVLPKDVIVPRTRLQSISSWNILPPQHAGLRASDKRVRLFVDWNVERDRTHLTLGQAKSSWSISLSIAG